MALFCWLPTQAEEPTLAAPLVGEPFEFHGEVISVGVPGQGLVLALAEQNVAVHGLGPVWFWDAMGWPWPMVGDAIVVRGREVRIDQRNYRVATWLSFSGHIIELRDRISGQPRWRDQGLYVPLKEERP